MTQPISVAARNDYEALKTTAALLCEALKRQSAALAAKVAADEQIETRKKALEPEAARLCEEAKKAGTGANNADTRKAKVLELIAADPQGKELIAAAASAGDDYTKAGEEVRCLQVQFDSLKARSAIIVALLNANVLGVPATPATV